MLGLIIICVIMLLFYSLAYIGMRLGQRCEEDEDLRKALQNPPRRRGN